MLLILSPISLLSITFLVSLTLGHIIQNCRAEINRATGSSYDRTRSHKGNNRLAQAATTFWHKPSLESLIAAAEYLGRAASDPTVVLVQPYRGIDQTLPWY